MFFHGAVPATIDKFNKNFFPIVIAGQSKTIDCLVYGVPTPRVIWFKNGLILSLQDNPHMRLSFDGRHLEILVASLNDTAVYECQAVNEAGQDAINYDLKVHGQFSKALEIT